MSFRGDSREILFYKLSIFKDFSRSLSRKVGVEMTFPKKLIITQCHEGEGKGEGEISNIKDLSAFTLDRTT